MGISPLALIAKQAGYEVSGSDKQSSQYLDDLKTKGITDISIHQSPEELASLHARKPIDWYVYSSAVKEDNPELVYARSKGIKVSKRDQFTNHLLKEKDLKLIAIAGTHGKTTTTAMVIWLFKQLGIPISYLVGTKISFGEMGQYEAGSKYFVYECDEFDRNFLAFKPFVSIISGVSYDHHEIYPTREDYKQAFRDFISQSEWLEIWQADRDYLEVQTNDHHAVLDAKDPEIEKLQLDGHYNRLDAWLAIKAVRQLTKEPLEKIVEFMNRFPGLHRRMEEIAPGIYSDEAHTPDKIRGAMSAALEMAGKQQKEVVVVYEPLTNRRQLHMMDDYKDCFKGAKKIYWVPSYLAREDPKDRIVSPAELISHLTDPSLAEPQERGQKLKEVIEEHLGRGDMIVAMAGGGGDSLDQWVRSEFKT